MYSRLDYVFSYWIFLWYLLYEFKLTTFSPKIPLFFGLIENCVILGYMIYFKNAVSILLAFMVSNLFIKVIPLWRLRRERFTMKDLLGTGVLFLLYIIWLHVNHLKVTKLHDDKWAHLKIGTAVSPVELYAYNYANTPVR